MTTVTNSIDSIQIITNSAQGVPGVGLPIGGGAGQVATKLSSLDYDIIWAGGAPNNQTGTSYTFTLSDANGSVTANNSSPQTFTIPSHLVINFPIGSKIKITALGAGIVTITINVDTIISLGGVFTLSGIGAVAEIEKMTTTLWVLSGDIG